MPSPTESPAPTPAAAGAPTPVNQIDLPLTEVIKKVPDRLKSLIAKIPGEDDVATFAASLLMPQLSKGSVKITFAELVEASPAGTFSSNLGGDDELIELPLALVISRLGTGSFQRKKVKKAATVEPQDFFGANRTASPSTPTPAAAAPIAPAPSAPAGRAPAFTPVFPDGPVAAKAEPAPAFAPAPPFSPAAETSAADAPDTPPDKAAISLAAILKTLPDELSACVQGDPPADAVAEFPAAALLPQLAKGKVKVTFAELVAAAPSGVFANTAGHEQSLVPLPLSEVLAKVGPGAFKRKAPTKQLAPSSDQKFFGGLAKPIEEPPEPGPENQTSFVPRINFQPKPPEESTPAAAAAVESEPAAPLVPPPPPVDSAGQKFAPEPIAPGEPATKSSPGEAATEVPILLSDLTAKFPDGLKAEIAKLPGDTVVLFPAEELGHAMKSGKIRFTWTQLRHWMRPKNYASAAWEGTSLDIPLKAIVGPFMAAMRGQPSKVKIPQTSSSAAPPNPVTPPPTPAAPYKHEPFLPSKPTSSPPASTPPPMDGPVDDAPQSPAQPPPAATASAPAPDAAGTSLGELLGQPHKTSWTPVEIVQHVGRLEGVGGAMLSLSEGQIAAAAIGINVKPDLIAFRVPRLLKDVAAHVEQMQLEPTPQVSFAAGDVQWVSFKLGNIFFTVHGQKGENLPITRLASIAAEVAQRK